MRSILTFDILNQQHCMTNSIRVIWISIFLLFSVTGQAQYTLSGIVSDKSDKTKLIEGATLFIPEFNRIDLSKEGGTYIFRNLHQGESMSRSPAPGIVAGWYRLVLRIPLRS